MADIEKSLGAQPPMVDDIPAKLADSKLSSDDAESSEETGEKPEKEKKGGFKDYLVSTHGNLCSELQIDGHSEFSIMRIVSISCCTPLLSRGVSWLAPLFP